MDDRLASVVACDLSYDGWILALLSQSILFSIVYSIKGILPFSHPSQPAIRPAIQLSSYLQLSSYPAIQLSHQPTNQPATQLQPFECHPATHDPIGVS